MTINLYSVSDDARKLTKTLGSPTTISCEMIYPTNVFNPQIRISSSNYDVTKNYAYIPELARYYFVTDATFDNGGAVILTLRVDVLMSFNAAIKSLSATAVRNENAGTSNLVDTQIPITAEKNVSFIKLNPSPFNVQTSDQQMNFVLCIAGGNVGGGE